MGTSIIVYDKDLPGGKQTARGYEIRRYYSLTEASRTELAVVQRLALVWTGPTIRGLPDLKPRRSKTVGERKYQAATFRGSVIGVGATVQLQIGDKQHDLPLGAAIVTFQAPVVARPLEILTMVLEIVDQLVTPAHLLDRRQARGHSTPR